MASLIHEPARPRKPWRVDYVDRRKRRTRRFATRREAQTFVGEVSGGRRRAEARLTLEDWLTRWVTVNGLEWEQRTRKDRAADADRLIVPELGALRLHEITRAEIRSWRADLRAQGVSAHRVNRAVSILSAALGAAVDEELIAGNPCRGMRRLPEPVRRRLPATLNEVEEIRLAMETSRDRAIISLLAYAGARPGELATLAWSDVGRATIVIRSAAGAGGIEKQTKTGSRRSVPIIAPLRDDLEELVRSGPLVLGRGVAGRPHDYPNWQGRVFRPARPAGSSVTPYALRHTFASLLIAEGRPPHEVARLLGHSTPVLTLTTYGHLFDEAQLAPHESMEAAAMRARAHAAST